MDYKVLKLGLLLDSVTVPNWLYNSLVKLQNDKYVDIVLSMHTTKTPAKQKSFLYNLYQNIDQKLVDTSNSAKELKEVNQLFSNLPKVDWSDTDEIEKFNLDIIVNLSSQNEIEKLLTCATYGVFSYVGVDDYNYFYDVVAKKSLLSSFLVAENKNKKLLLSTSSSQILDYSVFRDENEQLWTLASLLPQEIKKLSRLGEKRYFGEKKEFVSPNNKLSLPSNFFMICVFLKQFSRVVKKIVQKKFFKEQWFLMYKNEEDFSFQNIGEFKSKIPSVDNFWADPFVVDFENKRYIFVEEEPLNSHGYISLITLEDDGSFSNAVPIIKKPYHISYPFVFIHEGKYFMVPETSENKTIELYEAIEFPYKWEFKQNLMSDIHAVDTTLFFKDDKWWLFTSITEFEGGWDNGNFSLFFSDNLFGEWSEHPQNPIIVNPNHSRMAGAVFEKDSKIYRPSQNSTKRYGYGFNLEEITKLTTTHYKEKTVSEVIPNWDTNILGAHTINFAKDFTIIDGVQMRSRFK
jgi:hypothetical protein